MNQEMMASFNPCFSSSCKKTFSTTIGGRCGLAGPSANAGSAKIGGPADPWDPAAKTGSVTI